ncbi:AcrVA2 [Shewanella phage vB_SbaS_Y11]|nr:AcrVA2 [Shewanella phage vB_SbaS_Y11]
MQTNNAFSQLVAMNKKYPDIKETFKKMQHQHLTGKNKKGVFCPSHIIPTLSTEMDRMTRKHLMINQDIKSLFNDTELGSFCAAYTHEAHLFGTWRNSLGVYRIDEEILQETIKSAIPDDTPSAIFSRLPDWCVYIELPEMGEYDKDGLAVSFRGFWALLDEKIYNMKSGQSQLVLNIIPDYDANFDRGYNTYIPIQMAVDDSLTVAQSIEKVKQLNQQVVKLIDGTDDFDEDRHNKHNAVLRHLLPILLWLCAEEPDITNINGEPVTRSELSAPKHGINKKTGSFVPPSQPIVYNIGQRLGGEIRTFNEDNSGNNGRASTRKRPHIRRGHWHGVWRGTGQNKHFHTYWQPAVFVNAKP